MAASELLWPARAGGCLPAKQCAKPRLAKLTAGVYNIHCIWRRQTMSCAAGWWWWWWCCAHTCDTYMMLCVWLWWGVGGGWGAGGNSGCPIPTHRQADQLIRQPGAYLQTVEESKGREAGAGVPGRRAAAAAVGAVRAGRHPRRVGEAALVKEGGGPGGNGGVHAVLLGQQAHRVSGLRGGQSMRVAGPHGSCFSDLTACQSCQSPL